VVLVHGTASSVGRWANMIDDLLADPRINDRFEFWLFSYATGARRFPTRRCCCDGRSRRHTPNSAAQPPIRRCRAVWPESTGDRERPGGLPALAFSPCD
jgi:hypothetical protein